MDPIERKVVVADSGPGIADKMRPHLFELFYSLKNPPSGLGLYICQYYMRQMKGTIRESSKSEILPGIPGAHFTIIFPKEEE
jgi:signal transduction histidine kinase